MSRCCAVNLKLNKGLVGRECFRWPKICLRFFFSSLSFGFQRINKFMMMTCDWHEAKHRVPKDCGRSEWASGECQKCTDNANPGRLHSPWSGFRFDVEYLLDDELMGFCGPPPCRLRSFNAFADGFLCWLHGIGIYCAAWWPYSSQHRICFSKYCVHCWWCWMVCRAMSQFIIYKCMHEVERTLTQTHTSK